MRQANAVLVVTTGLMSWLAGSGVAFAQRESPEASHFYHQRALDDVLKAPPPINVLSDAEKATGWQLLWDGATMNGWHKFGGGAIEGWNAEDGVLIGLSEAGTSLNDIVTDAEFEDFELTFDWAIAPKAESGVFFNVIEQGLLQASDSGPEYQLIDDRGWPEKLPRTHLTGASHGMLPPARKAAKYAGDWNRSRLVVRDGKVEHFLNGVKVVQYELGSPEWMKLKAAGPWKNVASYGSATKGRIALQSHGGKVAFCNIKIRSLPPTS